MTRPRQRPSSPRATLMCVLAALLSTAVTTSALATPPTRPRAETPGEPQPKRNFWDRMGALHGLEIEAILAHAQDLYNHANQPLRDQRDVDIRGRLLADARGMLRYALGIASENDPERVRIIALMAMVEEASGHTEQALALYQDLFEGRHRRPISGQACLRYGFLMAHLDDTAQAITILEQCLGYTDIRDASSTSVHRDAIVSLANLYALEGRMVRAISVLENGRNAFMADSLTSVALMALYDKDGQITNAYQVIERLQLLYENQLFVIIAREVGDMNIVPIEERHYMMALTLELGGSLLEAREQWQHYLRSGTRARFAQRAREHIRDIDALLSQQAGARDGTP